MSALREAADTLKEIQVYAMTQPISSSTLRAIAHRADMAARKAYEVLDDRAEVAKQPTIFSKLMGIGE